jgi:hypothetical protein
MKGQKMKLHSSMNPLGWVFIEKTPGQRLTKDDTEIRPKEHESEYFIINEYGVLIFRTVEIARKKMKNEKLNYKTHV